MCGLLSTRVFFRLFVDILPSSLTTAIMSELDDHTPASSGESMLLAVQAVPKSVPINVLSTASIVPTPIASQFSRDLEDIRVAETLVSIREEPNTNQRSHTLDSIPETQDLDVDLEVVLPHVGVSVGHLPYDAIDPNSTTLLMHSTPGIDSWVIGIQTDGIFYQYLVGLHHPSLLLYRITHTHNLTLYTC